MLGSILLLLAIHYVLRRTRIKNIQARLFPTVPQTEFERWRHYELLSIDVFLVCALVAAYSLLGVEILLFLVPRTSQVVLDELDNIPWTMLVLALVGLLSSAVYGNKAARLRKKYVIRMPHY